MLDLDQRHLDRAPHRGRGRGRLCLDQRGRQALSRRAVRRRKAIRHRARGMLRGDARLHAGEEHPRAAEAKGVTVIPGRRAAASPGSMTTALSITLDPRTIACFGAMDSGLRPPAGPGMTTAHTLYASKVVG